MNGKRKSGYLDLKFFLFCLFGAMTGYLLVLDRSVSFNLIWNNDLWLLIVPFVFGIIYDLEFFVVSFWLLVVMLLVDCVYGIDLSLAGPSCWSGVAVWVLTVLAGFAGCVVSLFIPQDNLIFESLNPKI